MTLEEIKKGLEFMNEGWKKITEQQRKDIAHIAITGYQAVCEELLKMAENK